MTASHQEVGLYYCQWHIISTISSFSSAKTSISWLFEVAKSC